jgi:hypothetical protein
MVAVTEHADVRKNYGSVMQLSQSNTVPDLFKSKTKIEESRTADAGGRAIPVIDFSGLHVPEKRAEIVEQMRAAGEEWGFFQVCCCCCCCCCCC